MMLIQLAEWRFNMLNSVAMISEEARVQREGWGRILRKLERLLR